MTLDHTFSDEPLAGGNSFQNAFRGVAEHLSVVEQGKKKLPLNLYGDETAHGSLPDIGECIREELTPSTTTESHVFSADIQTKAASIPIVGEDGIALPANAPALFKVYDPQAFNASLSSSPRYPIMNSASALPTLADVIPSAGSILANTHASGAVSCAIAEPEAVLIDQTQTPSDALGDELASLSEASHHASAPRVDLTRSARNEQSRTVNQQQAGGNKKPRNSAARPSTPPRPVKAQPLMQSEKSRNYLRQAMQTAVTDEDGVDHLNTSSSAGTRLGQALEINAHIPFHHPDLGPFKSVGGLWYFIGGQVQDEQFRGLFGKACRMLGKTVKMREIQGFKTIIAEATWIKIFSDDALRAAMTESTLPFRCYYLQGEMNLRVAALTEEWYMPILEEIRWTLKAMEETGQADMFPDFAFLEARRTVEKKPAAPKAAQPQRVQHQRY